MAIFGLFGNSKLTPAKIAKLGKLACNPFAQPDVRVRELERLLGDGTEGALDAAIKRFSINANGHIADEDEKKWLENRLVELGDVVVEALKRFIRGEKQLTYALRALRRIVGEPLAVEFFLETLLALGPDDYRSADSKLQLVWQLAEDIDGHPEIVRALVPFVGDHADDVRWAVLDLVEQQHVGGNLDDELIAGLAGEMGEALFAEDTSPRISRRIVELFASTGWAAGGTGAELPTLAGDEFFLDKKRFVRRRA